MKILNTNIEYFVPSWGFCNHEVLGNLTGDNCKFCLKHRGHYLCLLHEEELDVENKLIDKCEACKRATAGFKTVVRVADNEPTLSPKEIAKHAVKDYQKHYKQLAAKGYPASMAHELALKFVTSD